MQPTAFWHILRQLTNEEQTSILITIIQHGNAITTTKCKQSLCPSEFYAHAPTFMHKLPKGLIGGCDVCRRKM
jgi:Na+-translocating ferredoxin:NAD+ oxidoreductase RNF subunit RnfB